MDDLATALADLAPFRVTSSPKDVTIYGYGGKHLEMTVPDLPVEGDPGDDRCFTGCVAGPTLVSWVGAIDTEPGTRSTAARGLATARSSRSSTSTALAW